MSKRALLLLVMTLPAAAQMKQATYTRHTLFEKDRLTLVVSPCSGECRNGVYDVSGTMEMVRRDGTTSTREIRGVAHDDGVPYEIVIPSMGMGQPNRVYTLTFNQRRWVILTDEQTHSFGIFRPVKKKLGAEGDVIVDDGTNDDEGNAKF
jgi:hypothetical protein